MLNGQVLVLIIYANSKYVGLLADMVVDSTGNAYVAWGTTGTSGWVKYDTAALLAVMTE